MMALEGVESRLRLVGSMLGKGTRARGSNPSLDIWKNEIYKKYFFDNRQKF